MTMPRTGAVDVQPASDEDGAVRFDSGKIFGFRAWEITYDDGIFRLMHEVGYLAEGGEVV
jgi:hypothetical protein